MSQAFEETKIPNIDKALLDALSDLFPDRAPTLKLSEKEVWFHAGEANVVRFLREHFNRQNDNILKE